MFQVYVQIISNFDRIKEKKIIYKNKQKLLFKVSDFNSYNLSKLKKNFKKNMIRNYLNLKNKRDKKVKIIKQNWIKEIDYNQI